MDPEAFYKRISQLVDAPMLRSRTAAVIGLGSGGSRVAAELGRLGVQLLLFERPEERLEEHNIVRHLLGYRSLGKPKLSEMVEYIRNLNPATRIEACEADVVEDEERVSELLERRRPDIIAVCTDNEPSKHAINAVALRLRVPQTGGAVYDGGIGGEVYRVRPGQACYGCLATHLQLQYQIPHATSRPDYTNPDNPDNRATCALSLDIEQIAILQCRMTIETLLQGSRNSPGIPGEVNLCVFANRLQPGIFTRPMHCEFFHVPKRADCLECGHSADNYAQEAERILSGLHAGPGAPAIHQCSPPD